MGWNILATASGLSSGLDGVSCPEVAGFGRDLTFSGSLQIKAQDRKSLFRQRLVGDFAGAGEGNRTPVFSLGSR
jgi:hypothetical protein